jgi:hypothetical protein
MYVRIYSGAMLFIFIIISLIFFPVFSLSVSSVKMSSFVTFGQFHADSIADTTTIPVSDNEM